MQSFNLGAGQNCQILHVPPGGANKPLFLYRIQMIESNDLELKIIGDGTPPVVITSKQKHKVIDIAATGNLYLEAVGKAGYLVGAYDCVGVR